MMMMSLVRPFSRWRLLTSVAVASLLMAPGTARGGDGDSTELNAGENPPEGVVLVEILEGLPKQLPPKGASSRQSEDAVIRGTRPSRTPNIPKFSSATTTKS